VPDPASLAGAKGSRQWRGQTLRPILKEIAREYAEGSELNTTIVVDQDVDDELVDWHFAEETEKFLERGSAYRLNGRARERLG
jgi:hypothetical protein